MLQIANNIREKRDKKGFSQEFMAIKLGMSQNNYSKIELGKIDLTIGRLSQICEILEVEMSDLIKESNVTLNNHNQKGGNFANTIIQKYSEKIIDAYENQINNLKEEISFLRNLLTKK